MSFRNLNGIRPYLKRLHNHHLAALGLDSFWLFAAVSQDNARFSA
jgi:hypothetical protein